MSNECATTIESIAWKKSLCEEASRVAYSISEAGG